MMIEGNEAYCSHGTHLSNFCLDCAKVSGLKAGLTTIKNEWPEIIEWKTQAEKLAVALDRVRKRKDYRGAGKALTSYEKFKKSKEGL